MNTGPGGTCGQQRGPSAPSVHSSQRHLRGLGARPSHLAEASPARALTCVHVPHGHHDPDPATQEEADLLCVQHLLDGREPLKAQSGEDGGGLQGPSTGSGRAGQTSALTLWGQGAGGGPLRLSGPQSSHL